MRLRNLTEQRLLEEWVDAVVVDFERLRAAPVKLPFPIVDLAERMFLLRCDVVPFPPRWRTRDGVLYPEWGRAVINRDSPPARIAFTVAHELAHWIIEGHSRAETDAHAWLSFFGSSDVRAREALANYLAGALLLPRKLLAAYGLKHEPDDATAADALGVSPPVLRYRRQALAMLESGFSRRDVDPNPAIASKTDAAGLAGEWRTYGYGRFFPWLPTASASIAPEDTVLLVGDFRLIDARLLQQLRAVCVPARRVLVGCAHGPDELAAALELRGVAGGVLLSPGVPLEEQVRELERVWQCALRLVVLPDTPWRHQAAWLPAAADSTLRPAPHAPYGRDEERKKPPPQPHLLLSDSPQRSVRDAATTIRNQRRQGKRVVLATGCYDVLTIAHVRFLKQARAAGDVLIVGVESDRRVSLFKGRLRPVNSISERIEVLMELECVDYVFVIDGKPTPELRQFYTRLYGQLKPDVLAVSEGDPHLEDRRAEIEAAGGRLWVAHRFEQGKSTTHVLQQVIRQNMSVPQMWYLSQPSLMLKPTTGETIRTGAGNECEQTPAAEPAYVQLSLPI